MPIFKVGFVVVFDRRCKDTNNMWGLQELHERRKRGCTATTVNYWLQSSCNDNIFFDRPHRQLAMRNKPRPGRCHNVSRSKCVIFVLGCPESLYIKYIFLIYIYYIGPWPHFHFSFWPILTLTHFDTLTRSAVSFQNKVESSATFATCATLCLSAFYRDE